MLGELRLYFLDALHQLAAGDGGFLLCHGIAHAEMLAIKDALRQTGQDRLEGHDIWVTLEPCAMCAGAISHMRFRRLYFAAYDSKSGAVDNGPCLFHQPTIHHRPEIIGGLQDRRSEALLQQFFAAKR